MAFTVLNILFGTNVCNYGKYAIEIILGDEW